MIICLDFLHNFVDDGATCAISSIDHNSESLFDLDITQGPGDAAILSREAVREGFQIVAAAGGDGTLNEVAGGIMGSGSALGVIPLGLGNDFARAIKLPAKLEDACSVL